MVVNKPLATDLALLFILAAQPSGLTDTDRAWAGAHTKLVGMSHADALATIALARDKVKDEKYGGKWPKRQDPKTGKMVTAAPVEAVRASEMIACVTAYRVSLPKLGDALTAADEEAFINSPRDQMVALARDWNKRAEVDAKGKTDDEKKKERATLRAVRDALGNGIDLMNEDREVRRQAVADALAAEETEKRARLLDGIGEAAQREAEGLLKRYGDYETVMKYLDALDAAVVSLTIAASKETTGLHDATGEGEPPQAADAPLPGGTDDDAAHARPDQDAAQAQALIGEPIGGLDDQQQAA